VKTRPNVYLGIACADYLYQTHDFRVELLEFGPNLTGSGVRALALLTNLF